MEKEKKLHNDLQAAAKQQMKKNKLESQTLPFFYYYYIIIIETKFVSWMLFETAYITIEFLFRCISFRTHVHLWVSTSLYTKEWVVAELHVHLHSMNF